MPRNRLALVLLLVVLLAAGCAGKPQPIEDARETLGTVVGMTVYPSENEDAALRAVEQGYTALSTTGDSLNAYSDPEWIANRFAFGYLASPSRNANNVTDFNQSPFLWRILPTELERVIQRVERS